jgi:hypothetical protein
MRTSTSPLLLASTAGNFTLATLTTGCQKHQEPAPAEQPVLTRVAFEAVASKNGTSAPGYLVISRKPIRSSKHGDLLITIGFTRNNQTPVRWDFSSEILKDSLYVGLYYRNTLLLDIDGRPTIGDAVQATLKVNGRTFTTLHIDANTYQNPANRWLHYDGKVNSGIEMVGRL